MNDQQQQHIDAQEASQMRASAQQMGLQAAAEHKERTIHNEKFLNELRKIDIDSDEFDWLKDEYPDWFSGVKAVTNRGDEWDLEADLIMQNKRERAVAESRPGRLLRNRPFMHAAMRGDDTPQVDAYLRDDIPGDREYWQDVVARKRTRDNSSVTDPPVTSREQSRIYGAAESVADLMTLSRNGAGLDSVSTVKTETNVHREEEDESTATRAGRLLG